jgi:glycosyltransferase involved in cell wall biosynthesis
VRRDRIHVVPNAWAGNVDFLDRSAARQRLGLPVDGLVVGWVGRLIDAKGADILLRAVASLVDLPMNVALIGEGPERPGLEAICHSLGLDDRIRFHGEVLDGARYFRAFDVFVLSSRTEGTPIVLFEAMAAGVPIVATSVGGVPDVVGDEGALLAPPEDPQALAAALRRALLETGESRARAAQAAQQLHERYPLEPWLDRYEALYRELIEASSAS